MKNGFLIKILNHFNYQLKCQILKIMHYLVQLRDQIFVKGYGFLSLAKNMGKIIGKIMKLWVVNKT